MMKFSNICDTHDVQIQYNNSTTNIGPKRKAKQMKKGKEEKLPAGDLSDPKYARMADRMRMRWANKR